MLEILTFTGVDENTEFDALVELSIRYPKVEFGLLMGSRVGGIFPSLDIVEDFRELEGVNKCLHLCGAYSRDIMKGGGNEGLKWLSQGFNRVQINLHGDFWDAPNNYGWIKVKQQSLEHFINRVAADYAVCDKIILQHRSDWQSVPMQHEKVEYLFDRSGGRGIEGFSHWPKPISENRVGYAGGIGPDNILTALEFVSTYPNIPMWLDMEGKIRKDGWLDVDAVETVCRKAFE